MPWGNAWTPRQVETFLRLAAQPKTSDQIAAEMRVSRQAVNRMARRHGVKLWRPCGWSDEAIDLLKTYLGGHKAPAIARLINKRLGTNFNATSIHAQTKKLGLSAHLNTGDYRVSDAAALLGMDGEAFTYWAKRLGIETWKAGAYRWVTIEDVEKMRQHFAPPPEQCLSVKQAATRLGVDASRVRAWKMEGKIRHHKRGKELLIPVAEVERLLGEHGAVWRIECACLVCHGPLKQGRTGKTQLTCNPTCHAYWYRQLRYYKRRPPREKYQMIRALHAYRREQKRVAYRLAGMVRDDSVLAWLHEEVS